MHTRAALVAFVLAAACGDGAPPTSPKGEGAGAGGESPGGDDAPAPAEDLRVLGAGATFADLVAAARRLDERQEADSEAGCLLRGAANTPWRLEADLSVAVRPLPDAPADLDARLDPATAPVRVLTRWGQLGATAGDLALVAFTSTPPLRAEGGAALFVTDQGVYLRRVGPSELEPFGPVSADQAGARLAQALEQRVVPVFVSAEAGVSVARLADVLRWLPDAASGVTALAVSLAPETRLPETAERSSDESNLCPDGLPEPDPGTEEGELSASDIVGALTPLREGARRCFDGTTGAAATGGRVSLALRIAPGGEVVAACFTSDDIGDPGLRSCVVEAARATRFPPPSPPGIVDAVVPLVFEPDASLRQVPLCR